MRAHIHSQAIVSVSAGRACAVVGFLCLDVRLPLQPLLTRVVFLPSALQNLEADNNPLQVDAFNATGAAILSAVRNGRVAFASRDTVRTYVFNKTRVDTSWPLEGVVPSTLLYPGGSDGTSRVLALAVDGGANPPVLLVSVTTPSAAINYVSVFELTAR